MKEVLNTAVTSLSTVLGHTKTWAKMNSPEIMLFAGIGAGIGALITTQRATLKVATVKSNEEETKKKIVETAAKYEEDPDSLDRPYTKEDATNDMVLLKRKTALEYVKLYAGPVILEAVSIGLILGSHHIMKQRQAALAASCAAIAKAYQTYRQNVINKYGEEVDKEMLYGSEKKTVKKTETDPETGEKKKVTEEQEIIRNFGGSPYARLFNRENSTEWFNDNPQNEFMLAQREKEADTRLKCEGILTLNDVYRMIGLKPTDIGLTHGWRYRSQKDPDYGKFDNNVTFLTKWVMVPNEETGEDERTLLIDFNCDGCIYGEVSQR
jgi:hypothetical protein